MKVLGVTGTFSAAIGERYFSQFVSRLKNLSAPAKKAVLPKLKRNAVASFSISFSRVMASPEKSLIEMRCEMISEGGRRPSGDRAIGSSGEVRVRLMTHAPP